MCELDHFQPPSAGRHDPRHKNDEGLDVQYLVGDENRPSRIHSKWRTPPGRRVFFQAEAPVKHLEADPTRWRPSWCAQGHVCEPRPAGSTLDGMARRRWRCRGRPIARGSAAQLPLRPGRAEPAQPGSGPAGEGGTYAALETQPNPGSNRFLHNRGAPLKQPVTALIIGNAVKGVSTLDCTLPGQS
jgi:hypothetical protein